MKILLLFSMILTVSSAFAELKNEQHLFNGLVTRAGVKGQKPLSLSELENLCEKGYSNAYFLYSGAGNHNVSCSKGKIHYESSKDEKIMLTDIFEGFRTGKKTFIHCNNGAHASGFIAAYALIQFCDLTGPQAFEYWQDHAKSYPLQASNLAGVKKRILNFQPDPGLKLSSEQRQDIGCSEFDGYKH